MNKEKWKMGKFIHPLQTSHFPKSHVSKKQRTSQKDFASLLTEAQKVKVSKHAKQRMIERNIQISEDKWQDISEKMNEARMKGITDALVVTDNTTLVVSTKNNTVVTALLSEEANDKIFTNINGAIVLNN